MILSDSEMKRRLQEGDLVIDSPLGADAVLEQIGPASIDFRLGNKFRAYKRDDLMAIDPRKSIDKGHIVHTDIPVDGSFILHPRQFVLANTMEYIKVPRDLVARAEGRSSLGRLGLIIHSTAGYIDPGFEGTITLEITNINEIPIVLYAGMRIGQFSFSSVLGEVAVDYSQKKDVKYQGQTDPEVSRISCDKY